LFLTRRMTVLDDARADKLVTTHEGHVTDRPHKTDRGRAQWPITTGDESAKPAALRQALAPMIEGHRGNRLRICGCCCVDLDGPEGKATT